NTSVRQPRSVCGCPLVECTIVAMVAPLGPRSRPSTCACFEFARVWWWRAGGLRAAFARPLDADRAFALRARLRLDMQNSSHSCRRNSAPEGWRNSAPPPPKPRGGRQALAGERSEPVRLAVRDHHTRSLCAQSPAQSEQWYCWIGRRRIFFVSAEISATQRCSAMTNVRARMPVLILASGLELRIANAAA